MSARFWACVSGGGCITGIVVQALPYLQALALIISIAAGIRAWVKGKRPPDETG